MRHIGNEPRPLAERRGGKRLPVEAHLARERRQQSEQGLEQRALAATIGAEQGKYFAGGELERERASDHALAVADGQVLGLEHYDQLLWALASSQMKNGVPMTAVRIPSGISTGAAVRAKVSINSR